VTATAPRVVAEGRLVRLREKQTEDAKRDYEWRKDRELAAYDATRPITMTYRAFVTTLAEDLRHPSSYRHTYAIEEREGGTHIGNIMYYGYDTLLSEAELGITIGDRDYWARGYGSDAVRTLLAHVFDILELRRVYLHTLTSNLRAQAAFRRAGFRRTRSLRRDGYDFEATATTSSAWRSCARTSMPSARPRPRRERGRLARPRATSARLPALGGGGARRGRCARGDRLGGAR
jgi:RimJ/RimL family protein N-acetyltransferase